MQMQVRTGKGRREKGETMRKMVIAVVALAMIAGIAITAICVPEEY